MIAPHNERHLRYLTSSVLASALKQYRRFRQTGLYVENEWLAAHLDDDFELTATCAVAAGMVLDGDVWRWRRGGVHLSRAANLERLGDMLVSLVDQYRPV